MHGRLKVRTTEEQRLLKQKEQQKKLTAYRLGMKQILNSRKPDSYDPESLAICAQLLIVNPDIYTLWNYRKEVVLMELEASKKREEHNKEQDINKEKETEQKDDKKEHNKEQDINKEEETGQKDENSEDQLATFLENELRLTEQCLLANPKSYSSWHHRYWILEHNPKANWQKEFDLCNKYLTMDERNFHCWDYRRLILNKIGISVEDELKFSTERININFSNYSSWHYRSTLRSLNEDSVNDELALVTNALFTDPADSSAWFYLRWVLSNPSVTKEHKQELLDNLNQLLELEPDCRWILVAKCWLTESLCSDVTNVVDDRISCYKKLEEIDSMRKGQYLDYQGIASNQKDLKE